MNPIPISARKFTAAAIVFSVVLSFHEAEASIIAMDDFDSYTAGNALVGGNGGSGFNAAWGSPGANVTTTVVAGTMSAAGINGGVNAVQVAGSGNISGARALDPITATFYVGALVRLNAGVWDGSNTFSFYASNGAANTGINSPGAANNTVLTFGMRNSTAANDPSNPLTAGSGPFMLRAGTGAPPSTASVIPFAGGIATGSDYYLVARYNYSGTNFDSIDMWLNPMGAQGAPQASLSLTAGFGLTSITNIFGRAAVLQTTGAIDQVWFDQLKLGTEWTDVVVPEPSTGLLGLFACGFALLRRRRA